MANAALAILFAAAALATAKPADWSVPSTECCIGVEAACWACQLDMSVEEWCAKALHDQRGTFLVGCESFTRSPSSPPTPPTKRPTFHPSPYPTQWPTEFYERNATTEMPSAAPSGETAAPSVSGTYSTTCCLDADAKCWACQLGKTVDEWCIAALRNLGTLLIGCEHLTTPKPTRLPTYYPSAFPTQWPTAVDMSTSGDDSDTASGGNGGGAAAALLLLAVVGIAAWWYRRVRRRKAMRLARDDAENTSFYSSHQPSHELNNI